MLNKEGFIMNKSNKILMLVFSIMMATLPLFAVACNKKAEVVALENCAIEHETEFGGIYIKKTIDEFNALGFVYGDSVNVVFSNGYEMMDIPYYNGYYTKNNEKLLVAYKGYPYIKVTINNGNDIWYDADFAKESNGNDLWLMSDFSSEVTATITLAQRGKYKDIQDVRNIEYRDQRNEYPSDIVFANFRSLSGGNLKENFIYRSASPCDNQHNRASYVDTLMGQAGVNFMINLADTTEKIDGYMSAEDFNSPNFASLYENNKVVLLTMNMNYASDAFKTKAVSGLNAILNNEGPFLVHCTEGKDRTGFMCLLIEAIAGATYQEIVDDYMVTYANYYGITKEKDSVKYNVIIQSLLNPMIEEIVGQTDIDFNEVDFALAAKNYVGDKMAEEDFNQLKAKICNIG